MRVTIRIPAVLTAAANGQGQLEVEVADGGTIGALFDAVARSYPLLDRRIRDERGSLRRFVNCYVDGEECRRILGVDTPLTEGAEVLVIPSVAGG